MNNEDYLMGEINKTLKMWDIKSVNSDLESAIKECCISFAQDALMDSDIADFVKEKMLEIIVEKFT